MTRQMSSASPQDLPLRPTMTRSVILLATLSLLLLTSCSADNLRHGLYEGIKTRNDLQSSPSERFGKPEAPSYPEYERLRTEQR